MPYSLKIIDKTLGGKENQRGELYLASERIKARELIEARVRQEVEAFNKSNSDNFYGLVKPEGAEIAINGFKFKKRRKLDANKQYEIALEAFKSNGFFILVDDVQVASPDEEITIKHNSKVTFIKLIPLAGG